MLFDHFIFVIQTKHMKALPQLMIAGIIIGLIAVSSGCAPHFVGTSWRADHVTPAAYSHILVVAIMQDKDSLLRKRVETEFSAGLQQIGYTGISSYGRFGRKGLSDLSEEDTYLKLCSNGIDAVITLALIRKTNQSYLIAGKHYSQANTYFYNRIWNYRQLQADTANVNENTEFFWESIVFDLASLEAACTVKTKPFPQKDLLKITETLPALMIKQFLRENVIRRQEPLLRAF
jgi:hypothetical protein